ncbi:MAG: SLC13 family permease [Clostridiaceae bacterium]|nr:SLC13 family permease [Clostridiaceae bacterium]
MQFIKKDPVLALSVLAALLSMLLTPPDAGYFSYLNLRVLALLFCLMAGVAGLRHIGVLARLSRALAARVYNPKALALTMVLLCFLASTLLTNDVALLTFVPFTLVLPPLRDPALRLRVIVMETVAANLGSLGTPIGNPQNLFLYTYFQMTADRFFSDIAPLWVLSLVLVVSLTLLLCRGGIQALPEPMPEEPPLPAFRLGEYAVLLILCLLTVFGILDWRLTLAAVVVTLLLCDRSLLSAVDYGLLLTFVCFFIFVGNLGRCASVANLLEKLLTGRERLISALVSQVISNVPAAAMLAPFTDNARGLILGTNIGGLGTPVASMASLISYKLYAASEAPEKGRYLRFFSVINFGLLALLLLLIR